MRVRAGARRPRRRASASGSSATCTTGRSSGSSRCASTSRSYPHGSAARRRSEPPSSTGWRSSRPRDRGAAHARASDRAAAARRSGPGGGAARGHARGAARHHRERRGDRAVLPADREEGLLRVPGGDAERCEARCRRHGRRDRAVRRRRAPLRGQRRRARIRRWRAPRERAAEHGGARGVGRRRPEHRVRRPGTGRRWWARSRSIDTAPPGRAPLATRPRALAASQ